MTHDFLYLWLIPGFMRDALRALLNYNWRPGEWEPLADPILHKPLKGEVQLPDFVGEQDESRRIDLHLGDVTDLHIQGQSAAAQDLLAQKFVEVACRDTDEPGFVNFI